jgi:hypothetical protein
MEVTQVLLPGLATISSGRWGKMARKRESINYNTILQLDMFCRKEGE